MHCQFKDGCSNFAHKRCSILWSRTHGWNVEDIESIGHFCQEHYMDYDKHVLPTQTDNGTDCIWAWPNTERDYAWSEEDMIEFTGNGLWFVPNCKKCFRTNKCLNRGKICFVDTSGKHVDLIKQEATSCSHRFVGIRASTMTNSI